MGTARVRLQQTRLRLAHVRVWGVAQRCVCACVCVCVCYNTGERDGVWSSMGLGGHFHGLYERESRDRVCVRECACVCAFQFWEGVVGTAPARLQQTRLRLAHVRVWVVAQRCVCVCVSKGEERGRCLLVFNRSQGHLGGGGGGSLKGRGDGRLRK